MYNAKKNRVTLPLMIVKAKPQARASSNPLKMLRNRLTDGMPDVTVSNSRAKQTSRTHSHGHKELVLVRGRDAVGCTHTRIRRGHTHTRQCQHHTAMPSAALRRGFEVSVRKWWGKKRENLPPGNCHSPFLHGLHGVGPLHTAHNSTHNTRMGVRR